MYIFSCAQIPALPPTFFISILDAPMAYFKMVYKSGMCEGRWLHFCSWRQLKSSLSRLERALRGKGQPHGKEASSAACLSIRVIAYGRTGSRGQQHHFIYSDCSSNNSLYGNLHIHNHIYFSIFFFFHIYICMETRCLIKHSFTLYFVGSSLAKGWSARQHPSESLWLCLLSTATRQGHTTRCPLLKPRTGSTLITQCHCSSCLGPAGLLECCNVTIRMLALDLLICIFHLLI